MSTEPQGWQAPKTNWQPSDPVGVTDFNRIEGNANAIETGSRTIDQTQVPSSSTGTLRQFLDWFANRIKAITGATNWYDAPPITLAGANAKFGGTTGHKHTGAAGDGPLLPPGSVSPQGAGSGLNADKLDGYDANTGAAANTIPVRDSTGKIPGNITGDADTVDGVHILSGSEASRPSPGVQGRLYVATDAQRIWRDTGTAWQLVAGVSRGVISMWSGSIDSIPSSWALCDGKTYTAPDGTQVTVPDLRDRFIVGAGLGYAVGATGGAAQVTLTADQIPAHSHSATVSTDGSHTHTGTTSNAGAHDHTIGAFQWMDWGVSNNTQQLTPGSTARTGTSGDHTHTFTTGQAGAHSHTVTIGNTGDGQPHENRPPYYALCFIMKL